VYPTVLYAWRRGPLYCTVLGYATVLQWAAGASLEHIDLASPSRAAPSFGRDFSIIPARGLMAGLRWRSPVDGNSQPVLRVGLPNWFIAIG